MNSNSSQTQSTNVDKVEKFLRNCIRAVHSESQQCIAQGSRSIAHLCKAASFCCIDESTSASGADKPELIFSLCRPRLSRFAALGIVLHSFLSIAKRRIERPALFLVNCNNRD